MSTGKIIIGVLAGIAVGAVLGVLFAPDKGSETRKIILKKGEEAEDDLQDKFDELLAELTSKFDAIKEEANNLSEKGKHHIEEIKKDLTTAMN